MKSNKRFEFARVAPDSQTARPFARGSTAALGAVMPTNWVPGTLVNRDEFIRRLEDRFPAIAAEIDGLDQGLLHLEMAVFARATAAAIDDGDRSKVTDFFAFAEEIVVTADSDVENAIYVSYLENIFLCDEPLRIEAQNWLPPRLAKGLVELEKHFERMARSSRST
jgi:hypothetical protein